MKVPKLTTFEIFLIQLIFWLILWLTGEFLATLLTLSIGAVVLAVLIIALVSEYIEPSRVPAKYFRVMGASLLAILAAAALYYFLFGSAFNPFGRG